MTTDEIAIVFLWLSGLPFAVVNFAKGKIGWGYVRYSASSGLLQSARRFAWLAQIRGGRVGSTTRGS